MNREVHVRFWESPEVKVLRATRQSLPNCAVATMPGLTPFATQTAFIAGSRFRRLRFGKSFFTFCSIGRRSHVFGLLMRLT